MLFYLGTHHVDWLAKAHVPLFVSRRRLVAYKKLPRAICRWALDSGGFTELSMYGQWTIGPKEYATEVRQYRDIGHMDFAAPQDWMCEPVMLRKTGKTVQEHQRLTLENYEDLLDLAPEVPWLPVLQGWTIEDYLQHVDDYQSRGHQLSYVGLGSVCRRQATSEIAVLVEKLVACGLQLHGFGVKTQGLGKYGQHLRSADSLAWSFTARRERIQLPGHTHKNCANCLEWALRWRGRISG